MNQIQKVKQAQYSTLTLEYLQLFALAQKAQTDVLLEVFCFYMQYAFLFENSENELNSCEVERGLLYATQRIIERPIKYTDPDGCYSINAFKQDMKFALKSSLNCDFGRDYCNYATQAWNNKHYLAACIYELDATSECMLDLGLAYGGAKAVGALVKAAPMLYGTLASLSSSSTVVLGKYDSGSCGGYTKMADKIGGKVFCLPDGLYKALNKLGVAEKVNSAWLNGVVKSGARILLNSDPMKAMDTETAYGMEMRALSETHTFKPVIEKGIECWEAIAK